MEEMQNFFVPEFNNDSGTITLLWILQLLHSRLLLRGTVTDGTSGDPMPGVNIVVSGTTTGTMTDAAGSFTLDVPNANATLQFSFIGYVTQSVPLGGRTTLAISLTSDVAQLREVVVVGYGTQLEKRFDGFSNPG